MLLLKAKRINTYNNKEQKEIYDEVIKNFDKFSESEQIDLLLIMRTYFLKQATLVEKREYVKKVVISIKKQSNFIAQIIELSSIIYKYTTKSLQNEIFDAVFLVNDMKPRKLVAILYFIKNTHRVYNKKQFDISRKKIEEITKEAPEYLTDAITSLNNDISKDFKKKGKYLFLIPEFLNGTTFVQPPLALMNCATYLKNDFSIDVDILEELLSLGGLGIQYCIKSELAYSKLHEIKEDLLIVEYSEFNDKYNQRDTDARQRMRDLVDSDANKVTKVFSTLFER